MKISSNNITCDCCNLGKKIYYPSRILSGAINATSITQIVGAGQNLIFTTNRIVRGTAISHVSSTSDFNLFMDGIYQIIFTSNIAHNTQDNNALLSTSIQLNNGIILSTMAKENVKINEIKSITTHTLVNVPQNVPVSIRIINTSDLDTIYTNTNITIIKL